MNTLVLFILFLSDAAMNRKQRFYYFVALLIFSPHCSWKLISSLPKILEVLLFFLLLLYVFSLLNCVLNFLASDNDDRNNFILIMFPSLRMTMAGFLVGSIMPPAEWKAYLWPSCHRMENASSSHQEPNNTVCSGQESGQLTKSFQNSERETETLMATFQSCFIPLLPSLLSHVAASCPTYNWQSEA